MGDNGAGKSTFVRQITGCRTAHPQRDHLQRRNRCISKARWDAREAGIETVFQTLAKFSSD